MASLTFNREWDGAQTELKKLNLEEAPRTINEDGSGDAPAKIEPMKDRTEVIDTLRTRYIRYVTIIKKLENCYDQIIQPQKRILLRKVLDDTMGRLLEIKQELVTVDLSDFHYLDDLLSDMKMTPQDVEIPIPRYFLQRQALVQRMQLLKSMMDKFNLHDTSEFYQQPSFENSISVDEAIALIQQHERARQGRLRAKLVERLAREDLMRDPRNYRVICESDLKRPKMT